MATFIPKAAAEEACKTDDKELLSKAIQEADPPSYVEEILSNSFRKAVRCRSMQVLTWLLIHHQDHIQSIQPTDITVHETARARKISKPSVPLLNLLHEYGYNVNHLGVPFKNSGPLLWQVCYSPKLVQWCLDRGAELIIPQERTSIDPMVGDIYHTPRHPLLLEMVAAQGSLATFQKLLKLGAPLSPGSSWHQEHSPRILHYAILSAVKTAPYGRSNPSKDHQDKLKLIRYLVDDLKLDVDGISVRVTKLVEDLALNVKDSDAARAKRQPWFLDPNREYYASYPEKKRNLREIVKILLDQGADLGLKDHEDRSISTPLICARHDNVDPFTKAVKSWQDNQRKASRTKAGDFPGLSSQDSAKVSDLKPPFLEQIPLEILGTVAGFLELADLKNCRLTSRRVSSGAFQRFRFFRGNTKTTLSIQDLTVTISHVKQLTLDGYFIDEIDFRSANYFYTDTSLRPSDETVLDLLRDLFAKSKQKLKSIILSVTGSDLRLLFQALQENNIQLHALKVHSTNGPGWATMTDYQSALNDWSPTLSSIRRFVWSLDRFGRTESGDDLKHTDRMKTVLSLMPEIETLDLSCMGRGFDSQVAGQYLSLFEPTAYNTKLKECILSGSYVTPTTLRQFLNRTTARRLTLRNIYMAHGEFEASLKILTSGKFDYFHLEYLYEMGPRSSSSVIRFEVSGDRTIRQDRFGSRTIKREGRETRRKLVYRLYPE